MVAHNSAQPAEVANCYSSAAEKDLGAPTQPEIVFEKADTSFKLEDFRIGTRFLEEPSQMELWSQHKTSFKPVQED